MATQRYNNRRFRTGRRGVSVAELILALCVISGLVFVSMRINAMGFRASDAPMLTHVAKVDPELRTPTGPISVTR
jgi:hypothetical protein